MTRSPNDSGDKHESIPMYKRAMYYGRLALSGLISRNKIAQKHNTSDVPVSLQGKNDQITREQQRELVQFLAPTGNLNTAMNAYVCALNTEKARPAQALIQDIIYAISSLVDTQESRARELSVRDTVLSHKRLEGGQLSMLSGQGNIMANLLTPEASPILYDNTMRIQGINAIKGAAVHTRFLNGTEIIEIFEPNDLSGAGVLPVRVMFEPKEHTTSLETGPDYYMSVEPRGDVAGLATARFVNTNTIEPAGQYYQLQSQMIYLFNYKTTA